MDSEIIDSISSKDILGKKNFKWCETTLNNLEVLIQILLKLEVGKWFSTGLLVCASDDFGKKICYIPEL